MTDGFVAWILRKLVALAVFVLAVVAVFASPVLLLVAALTDLATRRRGMARTRLVATIVSYLALQWVGLLAGLALWVASGFGLFMAKPWSRRAHYRVQRWWGRSLFAAARACLGVRVEFSDAELIEGGHVILAAQHASFFDALLPTVLLDDHTDLMARHVLKRELGWDPCLGTFGYRHPNHFVHRGDGDRKAKIAAIEDLAGTAGDEALIIFPEGTFRSATDPDRIFAKLAVSDPARAARLSLSHTLPPRSGGLLALLRGAPDADVVFLAHVGFEPFGSLRSIAASIPFEAPVQARLWRAAASEFGDDPDANLRVIDEYWQRMDDWIAGVSCEQRVA